MEPSARAEGPEWANKCLWQERPRPEPHPRKGPVLLCLHRADAKLRAVSSVRAICSQGGKEKLFSRRRGLAVTTEAHCSL